MAAKRKCAICNEYIGDGEFSVPYKKRYAHERCFNLAIRVIHLDKNEQLSEKAAQKKTTKRGKVAKPKAELKDGMSEEEYTKKKSYYEYLRTLMTDSELSAKVYAISEKYIENYKFTWEGMYLTLVYLHEIIEKDLTGDVVGIIPYYYSEAAKYYESIKQIEEQNKNIDVSKMYQEKIVRIQPKKRKIRQMDISLIGLEE